jgi:small subunit ribosomal protein S8
MTNDPIADMLTRIRNALMAGKQTVEVPKSKMVIEIARILKDEGYIEEFAIGEEQPAALIHITLKYFGTRRDRRPVITNLERVSKPGRRVYRGRRDLPVVLSGTGIAILTTPKGVMTAAQARREHVGGEVLCYIW